MNLDITYKARAIIEKNLSDENFGPEELVEIIGVSHSTLHRKLKEATGKTISRFIREIRLEKACELLLNEEITIAEVAYKVGFGSATYFNKCFHEKFKYAPGEYKKRYLNDKIPEKTKNQKTNYKKVALILFPLLLIFIILFYIKGQRHFYGTGRNLKKSIAVFPVDYLGNPDYQYKAEGIGEEIKNNLAKIEDIRVLDVSIVVQYRFANKPENEITSELNVEFLQKSTVQKTDNGFIIFIKLVNADDGVVLSNEKYFISDDDLFITQNEIAQTIAEQLHATITPEEKSRIEKIPTIDPDAYDFYQRGRLAHMDYWLNNTKSDALQKAEDYYSKALKHDSTFALAYVGLARIAFDKTIWSDLFKETYLDTVVTLANKALSYDRTLAEAYSLLGDCYSSKSPEKAVHEYQLSLQYNPNNWQAFQGLGDFYAVKDNIKSVENYLNAAKRHRGPEFKIILEKLEFICAINGLFDRARDFASKKLEWDEDSVGYFNRLAVIEEYQENFKKAIDYAYKGYKLDSTNMKINYCLASNYVFLKDYKNAFVHFKKTSDASSLLFFKMNNVHHRLGYIYWVNGDTATANKYFNRQIEACKESITLDNNQNGVLYDLAATYAILNKKEEVYKNLRSFQELNSIPWYMYFLIKNDPLFQNVRKEPEFQSILEVVKVKATNTRDELKKWFEKQESI